MDTLSNNTGGEGVELVSNLDRPILYFISEHDIKGLLRITCHEYQMLEEIYYDYACESLYYTELIHGTLGELIAFLGSFRNKPACGFAHEAKVILDGKKLEPENCMYQRKYTGCGHPELNGLLIAETLAEYFLQRAYPQIRMTARIKSSIHGSRNQQDGSAAQIYANPRLDKNPDGSIPINSNVQRLQFEAGKMVEVRCHELADAIKEAYN